MFTLFNEVTTQDDDLFIQNFFDDGFLVKCFILPHDQEAPVKYFQVLDKFLNKQNSSHLMVHLDFALLKEAANFAEFLDIYKKILLAAYEKCLSRVDKTTIGGEYFHASFVRLKALNQDISLLEKSIILQSSLRDLTSHLYRCFHKSSVVLIDNFLEPLVHYQNTNQGDELSFLQCALFYAFKDNEALMYAGLMGTEPRHGNYTAQDYEKLTSLYYIAAFYTKDDRLEGMYDMIFQPAMPIMKNQEPTARVSLN